MDKLDLYRHEYKYPISEYEIEILQNRVRSVMQKDLYAGKRGMYHISSLYFDDCNDSCLQENENGTDPREKFRLRIYNNSTERIALECKRKERGKCLKQSEIVSLEFVQALMNNTLDMNLNKYPELVRKFLLQVLVRGLHPVVNVEYDRIPYICQQGNVRVTFDMNITSSRDIRGFLNGDMRRRPIMPSNVHLLEVKYDQYLPMHIRDTLEIDNLTQMAFSKYYLCRKYSNK